MSSSVGKSKIKMTTRLFTPSPSLFLSPWVGERVWRKKTENVFFCLWESTWLLCFRLWNVLSMLNLSTFFKKMKTNKAHGITWFSHLCILTFPILSSTIALHAPPKTCVSIIKKLLSKKKCSILSFLPPLPLSLRLTVTNTRH